MPYTCCDEQLDRHGADSSRTFTKSVRKFKQFSRMPAAFFVHRESSLKRPDMREFLEGEEDGLAMPVGQSVVVDKYQFARVEARHRCLCNQSLQDGLVQFRASGQNPQIGLVRTGDE